MGVPLRCLPPPPIFSGKSSFSLRTIKLPPPFGRAKGFKLFSRLLLTLCAHKSDHNCRLMAPNEENKILHILTMDVGESHIKKFIFGDLSLMLTILTYL